MARLRLSTSERAEIFVDFGGETNNQVRLVSYSSEPVNINAFWNSNALDGSICGDIGRDSQ